MKNGMKVIDIEHHYYTKLLVEEYVKTKKGAEDKVLTQKAPTTIFLPLVTDEEAKKNNLKDAFDYKIFIGQDLGENRLKNMDNAGVDYAHISLTTPGAEYFPVEISKKIAADSNDILSDAVKKHPDRIGGWITLAPEDPEWSAKELERGKTLGLYGWSCLSNMNGKYIDDPKYFPILEKLEELEMPMYIHPNDPPKAENPEFGYVMYGPTFGFMVDAQYCLLRMIHRGIFDKLPKLKVILGHDGEGLPFFFNRIDTAYRQGFTAPSGSIKDAHYNHAPSYYIENNMYLTTSGNFLHEALRCSIDVMPKGRVMMSTDYPYEDFKGSVDFIADNKKLTDDEKKDILANNAMALGFGCK